MSTDPSPLPPLPEDERVLLLLGLLSEQDRHGYELNDFIEHNLQNVIKLSKATAYQLLDRLEQHGFIESRLEQHGQRPNRKVYRLTDAGKQHLERLLLTQLAAEEPLILPGNVPVMFSQLLPTPEVRAALETRLKALEARLALYGSYRMPCSSGVGLALERIRRLTEADAAWLRETLAQLGEARE